MTCDVTYDSDGKVVGDSELFAAMKGSMKILNFSDQDQWEIWRIVATVMHLGNFSFGGNFRESTFRKGPSKKGAVKGRNRCVYLCAYERMS